MYDAMSTMPLQHNNSHFIRLCNLLLKKEETLLHSDAFFSGIKQSGTSLLGQGDFSSRHGSFDLDKSDAQKKTRNNNPKTALTSIRNFKDLQRQGYNLGEFLEPWRRYLRNYNFVLFYIVESDYFTVFFVSPSRFTFL